MEKEEVGRRGKTSGKRAQDTEEESYGEPQRSGEKDKSTNRERIESKRKRICHI